MKEALYDFELGPLYGRALENLKRSCGFDPGKEMHRRMLDEAVAMRGAWSRGARLMAATAVSEGCAPRGGALEISGVRLECAAFAQLDASRVGGAAVYAVSLSLGGAAAAESVSEAFYEDLWGNAYVCAGVEALRERLAGECGAGLSDSFGPGYYGMDISQMKKLALLLDFGRIGARVEESSMISPLKSCAGLFFLLRGEIGMPEPSCISCAGDRGGCAFCSRNGQKWRTAAE
ncbi:MAG: hypothetical protein LBS32_07460 [Clostridiales Family XIII bacterium]|jgi:hypothetical protein|nr:hypothetical protein [Clostridiales Family XIII bacterium]